MPLQFGPKSGPEFWRLLRFSPKKSQAFCGHITLCSGDEEVAELSREEAAGAGLTQDEARYVTEMAHRIAALLLLGPQLDANYAAVKSCDVCVAALTGDLVFAAGTTAAGLKPSEKPRERG
jgi:hypothetical protein